MVIGGIFILNVTAHSCLAPLRIYILESCNVNDQYTGLSIQTFLGGLGAVFGFFYSLIDFSQYFSFLNSKLFFWIYLSWISFILFYFIFSKVDNFQIMFIFVTVAFFVSFVVTVRSLKKDSHSSQLPVVSEGNYY